MVRVRAAAGVGAERLAAVGRMEKLDAQHVKVLVVAGIDAKLTVVKRPRVEAVDPRPGVAAVVGAKNAAGLKPFGSLKVLSVRLLAAQSGGVGKVLAIRIGAR